MPTSGNDEALDWYGNCMRQLGMYPDMFVLYSKTSGWGEGQITSQNSVCDFCDLKSHDFFL